MYFEEAAKLEKDASGSVISTEPVSLRTDGDAAPRGRSEPTPLQGKSTDDELSPAARDALRVALRALAPHAAHPGVGDVLGDLRSVRDSDKGERFTGDDDDSTLGDELAKCEGTRAAIAKGQLHATADQRERLDKAAAQLQHEYLAKSSQGFARAQASREAEHARQRVPLVI